MQCGRDICLGAFVSNVKCMYASAFGHIIDSLSSYKVYKPDILLSYPHMK